MSYRICPTQEPIHWTESEDEYIGQGRVDLDVEALLRMSPVINDQDLARIASRHMLVNHVKSRGPVRETFFPNHRKQRYEDRIEEDWLDFDKFAVLLTCQTLAGLQDEYGIRDMLNQEVLYNQIGEIYNSADWKRLGFALYTLAFEDIVRDEITKLPFKSYIKHDRRRWAAELRSRVCNPQWVYALVHTDHVDSHYVRDHVNLVLIKLHLLDPPSVAQAFQYLSREVPDLSLDLVTTNYLGGPLDWHLLRPEVESVVHTAVYPGPGRPGPLTSGDVEVYYGVRVTEFIMEYARPLGLWSGRYAHNHRIMGFRGRCYLM